jgi:hypothetical protein
MFGKSQSLKQLCMTSSITEESGLIGRLIKAIFERKGLNSRLNFSMFQIYNENVYDSLQKDDVPLQVLEDVGGLSCVQGLSSFEISSEEDAFFLLAKGDKNRFVRETEYNAWSSRSHTMVMLEYSEMLEKGESKVLLL